MSPCFQHHTQSNRKSYEETLINSQTTMASGKSILYIACYTNCRISVITMCLSCTFICIIYMIPQKYNRRKKNIALASCSVFNLVKFHNDIDSVSPWKRCDSNVSSIVTVSLSRCLSPCACTVNCSILWTFSLWPASILYIRLFNIAYPFTISLFLNLCMIHFH